MDGSDGVLPCVGKLEIAKPKPLAFLCGTLPVLAGDAAFSPLPLPSPSAHTVGAPRYQMLPRETDLNNLPLLPHNPKKVFSTACNEDVDSYFENCPTSENLSRKCEALAVSALAQHGGEIDVVAPTDVLKQIFKIPYSKSRLSVAVHRVGDTLILKTGPDVEEGDKMFRRQNNQFRGSDSSVFLNFAMHSVRAEACDCPPGHYTSSEIPSDSDVLPGHFQPSNRGTLSPSVSHTGSSQFSDKTNDGFHGCAKFSQKKDNIFRGKKKQNVRSDPVSKTSQVGEKARGSMKESEKSRRVGNDGFLRVLFWQFHNFRMFLGSDLLLFSNEKYVAVSLHLWDVARQVTPLNWLEAWLDNVMASVPELAICYHQNGVIQGYELLKTDDIFLLKGISDDGTPAFHPQVVQQNGLSVLRFLQDNCKQDPGAYWLYKNAGEDVIQLYDLSILPKSSSTDQHDNGCSSLPSLMNKCRRDSLLSLGTLLYRIAHRLSLSKSSDDMSKCAKFFKKCLDFVSEQDQLVVRAYAHEQFARLILKCYQDLDMASEAYLLGCGVIVTGMEDDSSVFSQGIFNSTEKDKIPQPEIEDTLLEGEAAHQYVENCNYVPRNIQAELPQISSIEEVMPVADFEFNSFDGLTTPDVSKEAPEVHAVADPISSKLAAIHHVSQAIKSLRWNRQLRKIQDEFHDNGNRNQDRFLPSSFSVCSCGDTDCIEVCDIREWLQKSKMDHKLWKLVLLLGESYLALGEAYKEDGRLLSALNVVEIACSVYGSMPQHLGDSQFISSLVSYSSFPGNYENGNSKSCLPIDAEALDSASADKLSIERISSSCIFWAKTWTLVGDVFVEYYMGKGKDIPRQGEMGRLVSALRMSNEVVREVARLKKKLGHYKENCSTCSLVNCSCQNDRASSGISASSSSSNSHGNTHSSPYSRNYGRKSCLKNSPSSYSEALDGGRISNKIKNIEACGKNKLHYSRTAQENLHALPSDIDSHKNSSELDVEDVKSTVHLVESDEAPCTEQGAGYAPKRKRGGIFKFLEGPLCGEVEYNLSVAMHCYDEAKKVISGCHVDTDELQVSLVKKRGWVCNELGRYRLERKDLAKAELAFKDAIQSFREVSDHTNIILINCNMGHGRRALAEEIVSKMEKGRNTASQNAYKQSLKKAKLEYVKSTRHYEDAKKELNVVGERPDIGLHNEVWTQCAHTYLRLGMLLAKEAIPEDCGLEKNEQLSTDQLHSFKERNRENTKLELSAGDAFRESLSAYESLGDLRKQEAAFAHYHLACYHSSSCLNLLDPKHIKLSKGENNLRQKAKWYASLAERNWLKAIEFYGPKSHPTMYTTIILELSTLHLTLANSLHSNTMLDSALIHCLEVRNTVGDSSKDDCDLDPDIHKKFWSHLQGLLKRMLTSTRSGSSSKHATVNSPATPQKAADSGKLKDMYRMSLKSTSLQQLHDMYKLWMS